MNRAYYFPLQAGGSLIIAIVILIAMSIAAIGLVSSVESDLLVTDNFTNQQSGMHAADAGSEAAIKWIKGLQDTTLLYADMSQQGYYASLPAGTDSFTADSSDPNIYIDWDDDQCGNATNIICHEAAPALPTDEAGNSIRYIIHRLCTTPGSPQDASNHCLDYQADSTINPQKGLIQYGQSVRLTLNQDVYYRIITRTKGARNTIVFTQTMIHF